MHIDIRVAGEPPWDMAEREALIRGRVEALVPAGATVTPPCASCVDRLPRSRLLLMGDN
jgi:hypothetical protein